MSAARQIWDAVRQQKQGTMKIRMHFFLLLRNEKLSSYIVLSFLFCSAPHQDSATSYCKACSFYLLSFQDPVKKTRGYYLIVVYSQRFIHHSRTEAEPHF